MQCLTRTPTQSLRYTDFPVATLTDTVISQLSSSLCSHCRSSSSTQLQFSAAKGHPNLVRALLFHGAHADMADKHSVGEGCIE
jgi:hypothetical protein